jgi:radical SAM superfamily enzyme YgiQ (UPF0313 family)
MPTRSPERLAIDRGWYYAADPDGRIQTPDGRRLRRMSHGAAARVVVHGDAARPVLVRVASAVGRALEARGLRDPVVHVDLEPHSDRLHVPVDVAVGPRSELDTLAESLVQGPLPTVDPPASQQTPACASVLFFESLMASDMPHNSWALSQGVLHMVSAVDTEQTRVLLANVSMPILGAARTATGLDALRDLLQREPDLSAVCITVLEGYWEGVVSLIETLRACGSKAHVLVGGVLPTLAPEHVAAHLPGVTAVCRGAGEMHLPKLLGILGTDGVDTPFTPAQQHALTQLDGVLCFDPGGAVISARSDQVLEVPELGGVPLDLRYLEPRHVQGGIELATSRGCVHKCTFCSILGRERYQARSAGSIVGLLEQYTAHFKTLFGDRVPDQCWRVHFSDDDFACDPERAAATFRAVLGTPFRLSSAQVSIADLFEQHRGSLSLTLNPVLLDSLVPEVFFDSRLTRSLDDCLADDQHHPWSSYLQLGVETFCDAELVRLGKGYSLAHIRAAAVAMAARRLHWDAYFIVCNAETTADDLIDSLQEISRLKLRFPRWFHVRFPVVPRLVSYVTAASHRRMVRHGKTDRLAIRQTLQHPHAPELDYALVDHDRPADPWVAAAVPEGDPDPAGFFTADRYYLDSLVALRERWLQRLSDLSPQDARASERLIRRLDDAPRRLVFELLREHRRPDAPIVSWPGMRPQPERAMRTAESLLGPAASWARPLRRYLRQGTPRLVVIPTWQCELRCSYCYIPKQDGRVMTPETLDRSIDLLLSSDRDRLMLQFFGGEALLEWALVQRGIETATERAAALGKHVSFVVSSNGYALTPDKLAWLAQYPVKLELSLDGTSTIQNRFRASRHRGEDSYANGIAPRAADIVASGIPYDVIMVVHPGNSAHVEEGFFHIAELGFRRIQINVGLGFTWSAKQKRAFASGLMAVGQRLVALGPDRPRLVNLDNPESKMLLNGEVTVDWDGTVFGGNGFLHETHNKADYVVGHLDDLANFDRYVLDALTQEQLLEWGYPPKITANNQAVGAILQSFLRWLGPQVATNPKVTSNAPS